LKKRWKKVKPGSHKKPVWTMRTLKRTKGSDIHGKNFIIKRSLSSDKFQELRRFFSIDWKKLTCELSDKFLHHWR
jgi:hypothetical protein